MGIELELERTVITREKAHRLLLFSKEGSAMVSFHWGFNVFFITFDLALETVGIIIRIISERKRKQEYYKSNKNGPAGYSAVIPLLVGERGVRFLAFPIIIITRKIENDFMKSNRLYYLFVRYHSKSL